MPRLRKKWPRQRRAFRFIVPAGRRGRGPGRADPAGRPWRGNPHSPPWRRGPRLPEAVCRAPVRALGAGASPGAREPPSPGKEGGASAARGDAGLRASGRGECARRGACGGAAAARPRPSPERPPRAPAPAGRGRLLRARSRLPHALPLPAPGRPAGWGATGVRTSRPSGANSPTAGRTDAQGRPSGWGESGLGREPSLAPGPASRSLRVLGAGGWGVLESSLPSPQLRGRAPPFAGLVAEEDDLAQRTPPHPRPFEAGRQVGAQVRQPPLESRSWRTVGVGRRPGLPARSPDAGRASRPRAPGAAGGSARARGDTWRAVQVGLARSRGQRPS